MDSPLATVLAPWRNCTILVLDLFTGMDGLGHALDLLQFRERLPGKSLTILFECEERCRKLLYEQRCNDHVILSPWRDGQQVPGSVDFLVGGGLVQILECLPHLEHVLVGGGSPCVGFSRAGYKAGALGIQNQESSKMWILVETLALVSEHRPRVSLGCLLENVEMKEDQEAGITRTMGVAASPACCGKVAAAKRPRLFWQNLTSVELPPAEYVDFLQPLDPGWLPAMTLLGPRRLPIDFRYPTFLRPFQRGKPAEFPEPYPRLPLSQYGPGSLVVKEPLTTAERKELAPIIRDLQQVGGTSRVRGSPTYNARASICRFIHVGGGGRLLRPLRGHERDLCLGFPSGASALADDKADELGIVWGQLEASGNAFSPFVVAHFLKPWVAKLVSGKWPVESRLHIRPRGRQAILASLGGHDQPSRPGNS